MSVPLLLAAALVWGSQPLTMSMDYELEKEMNMTEKVLATEFSGDGALLAVVLDKGGAEVYNVGTGELVKHMEKVTRLGLDHTGNTLAYATGMSLKVDHAGTTTELAGEDPSSVSISDAGVVAACIASELTVWRPPDFAKAEPVWNGTCNVVAVARGGSVVAVAAENSVAILDTQQAWQLRFPAIQSANTVSSVALSSDGDLLALRAEGVLQLYDITGTQPQLQQTISPTHPSAPAAVASGPAGSLGTKPWQMVAFSVGSTVRVRTLRQEAKMVPDWETTGTGAALQQHGAHLAVHQGATVFVYTGCLADMIEKHYNIPHNGFRSIKKATQSECHAACCEEAQCTIFQWIEQAPTALYPQVQCLLFSDPASSIEEDHDQPFHTFVIRQHAPRKEDGSDDDDGFPVWVIILIAAFSFCLIAVCLCYYRLNRPSQPSEAGKNNVRGEVDMTLLDEDELGGTGTSKQDYKDLPPEESI